MTRIAAIAAAVLTIVALAVMALWPRGPEDDIFSECRSGAVGGDLGGPFTLMDATGKTVTDADVITGPSLVYFGYTFCPDVCPLDNARNAEAINLLDQRGVDVTPIFISVDPERDTPEVVGDFAANLHPRMIGLTGTPEQVKAASTAYRTYYAKAEGDDPDYYLIDHSTFSYLVFPDYGFVDFFRRDVTPEEMADRLQCFVEADQAAAQ